MKISRIKSKFSFLWDFYSIFQGRIFFGPTLEMIPKSIWVFSSYPLYQLAKLPLLKLTTWTYPPPLLRGGGINGGIYKTFPSLMSTLNVYCFKTKRLVLKYRSSYELVILNGVIGGGGRGGLAEEYMPLQLSTVFFPFKALSPFQGSSQ